MEWRDCTMEEAFEHAFAHLIDYDARPPAGADDMASVIVFRNGSATECRSGDDYDENYYPKWRLYK